MYALDGCGPRQMHFQSQVVRQVDDPKKAGEHCCIGLH